MFHTFTVVTITLLHTKWHAEYLPPYSTSFHYVTIILLGCYFGHTTICYFKFQMILLSNRSVFCSLGLKTKRSTITEVLHRAITFSGP